MVSRINIKEIEDGMILAEDVVDEFSGNILIPLGTVLNYSVFRRLENYNVRSILIKDEVDEVDEVLVNAILTESYNSVEEQFINVYEDLKDGKEVQLDENIDEFRVFSQQVSGENDILTQLQLLKNKDDYTYNHGMGVGVLAAKLGDWLGFTQAEIQKLSIAGIYHDIGKVKVDEAIVFKEGPLTDEEYQQIKKHPQFSYDIVKEHSDFDDDILDAIYHHHERLDGSGYPHGLKGDQISKFARVIAICDVYHAIISNRVYKPKDSPFNAARILRELSFQSFDPYIVRVFLDNISRFYVGNKVLLSDGRIGKIVYIDPVNKEAPIVKVGKDFIDFKIESEIKIIEITV